MGQRRWVSPLKRRPCSLLVRTKKKIEANQSIEKQIFHICYNSIDPEIYGHERVPVHYTQQEKVLHPQNPLLYIFADGILW